MCQAPKKTKNIMKAVHKSLFYYNKYNFCIFLPPSYLMTFWNLTATDDYELSLYIIFTI